MDDLFPDRVKIRVIDYETTGFPEDENAEVIDFGRVDVDPVTLEIGNMWQALARPAGPIPPATMGVHHIRDCDVADQPRPSERWADFWDGMTDRDFIAAHNADFERHFHKGKGGRWICTYRCALAIWPDLSRHTNQVIRYELGLDDLEIFDRSIASQPHRALPDAYVTAFILRELLRHHTPDQLADITASPIRLKTIRFGKHAGTAFADLPADYLMWMAGQKMDRDVLHTVKMTLKDRGIAA